MSALCNIGNLLIVRPWNITACYIHRVPVVQLQNLQIHNQPSHRVLNSSTPVSLNPQPDTLNPQ